MYNTKTILVTKKLGVQTKRPKILVCYDFHSRILDEEEDMMFATKLKLFSIRTMVVPTHIKLVLKPIYIPNFNIIESVAKQPIGPMLCVLVVNLAIPLDIVKQHLPKTFFHPKVGEMIIDETLVQERVQEQTIVSWIVIEEE
jgi:hypothetical protein